MEIRQESRGGMLGRKLAEITDPPGPHDVLSGLEIPSFDTLTARQSSQFDTFTSSLIRFVEVRSALLVARAQSIVTATAPLRERQVLALMCWDEQLVFDIFLQVPNCK
jgi:hypothetical protein